jgi:hypothetical protein
VACDTLRGGPARGRTPRDAEFSVIKTHLYCDFERTHDTRTPYAVDVAGGGPQFSEQTAGGLVSFHRLFCSRAGEVGSAFRQPQTSNAATRDVRFAPTLAGSFAQIAVTPQRLASGSDRPAPAIQRALPWRLLAEQRMSMQRMFAGSRQKLAPCRPKGDITPRRYRGIASRMKLGERVASTRDIASPADSKRTENCLSVRHAPPWTTSMLISTSQFG